MVEKSVVEIVIKSEKGNFISLIKNAFDNANKLMGKDKITNEDLEVNMER